MDLFADFSFAKFSPTFSSISKIWQKKNRQKSFIFSSALSYARNLMSYLEKSDAL